MYRALAFLIAAAPAAVACRGESSRSSEPPEPPATAVTDAAPPIDAGITTLPSFDPASGYHLDDTPVTTRPGGRTPARERRWAQILLRSTPSGAVAAVDGVRLGRTPVLWEGELDGRPREFTFVMAGHALARYRFVPVTSGIVHGTLIRVSDDEDAGVPAIPPVDVPPERPAPAPAPRVAPRPPPPPAPPPVDAAPDPSTAPGALDGGAGDGHRAAPIDAAPPPIGPTP